MPNFCSLLSSPLPACNPLLRLLQDFFFDCAITLYHCRTFLNRFLAGS
jgi:hypothetical protein